MEFSAKNLAKDLEIYQFFEVCKYLKVNIFDLGSLSEKEEENADAAVAKKDGVQFRKDFEKMEEEVETNFNKLPRKQRRLFSKVVSKAVERNQKNRKKAMEEFKKKYQENYAAGAVSEIPNVDSDVEEVSIPDVNENV